MTSTIRRILHAAGLVAPEPRKRPRSSYLRFEADMPNHVLACSRQLFRSTRTPFRRNIQVTSSDSKQAVTA